jgi:hypothetical protein
MSNNKTMGPSSARLIPDHRGKFGLQIQKEVAGFLLFQTTTILVLSCVDHW